MSWEAISAIAETVGVAAVVISLLYLARQTQQSRVAVEQNTKFAFRSSIDGYSNWRGIIASNPNVSELIEKANSGDEISTAEDAQLAAVFQELFMAAAFSYMSAHASGNSNTVDANFVGEYLADNPYGIKLWGRFRHVMAEMSPSFVRELDRSINDNIPSNQAMIVDT
jgi:hypothetical protein